MTALTFFAAASPAVTTGKDLPVLVITLGLHQGVLLLLDKPVYIVGSAATSDLLLSDPGITGRHMALRFADGLVAVEAMGGDVVVSRAHSRDVLIPAGRGNRARLPVDIRIGEARMTLSRDAVPFEPAKLWPLTAPAWLRKPQWIIALLLMFLCVGAFAFRGEPVSPLTLTAADKAVPPVVLHEPLVTATQTRAWLEQQLSITGLHQIKVSELDGQLSAQGTYGLAQKAQWIKLQQAFDSRFGQQVMLLPNVTARLELAKPRVRFQAVWFGPKPYVINDNGERQYPGATLTDNWTLDRIENDEVILVRGKERFTFTL